MMLLFAPHASAEKFSAPISGLRSLLSAPGGGTRGAGCVVVTRASVAASHRCGCDRREDLVKEEARDDADAGTCSLLGHGEDVEIDDDTAKADEIDITEVKVKDTRRGDHSDQARAEEEEDEMDGFWVSYGRRRPRRRRLPPPIPSLVARGALRRTRTDDGRLLIRIVPVVRPECVRARRRRRRVEHEDEDSPVAPPPQQQQPDREDGVRIVVAAHQADDDAAAGGESVEDAVVVVVVEEAAPAETTATTTTLPVMVPPHPPRVRSVGCFEEVFKLGSIRTSSLHQMQMPSLRMVH